MPPLPTVTARRAAGASDALRILVVAPEFPPDIGGMQVHALHTARYLAGRHHVKIVAPELGRPAASPDALTVLRQLRRQFVLSVLRLQRTLRGFRPDVVLVLNAGYAVLARTTSCPVVTRVVGNDFERSWIGPHLPLRFLFWRLPVNGRMAPGRWLRRFDQRFRNRVVAWGLESSRLILPNSTFTAAALRGSGIPGDRVRVVTGGVDVALFHPRPRGPARARLGLGSGPVLSTAARLAPKKGIDTVLRALATIVPRRRDLRYVIAGAGDDGPRLLGLARDLGVAHAVRFLGSVDHGELIDVLSASDVYVQCSRSAVDPVTGCRDVETMGRAACEASACGLPVVVSDSGGLPDVARDGVTGLVVREDDPAAVAAAIERLLDDMMLRVRLGTAGAALARRQFSWDVVGRRTEEALFEARAAGSVES